MDTPYSNLPPSRYWRSGVAEADPARLEDLYAKKFEIGPDDVIATAGSCFAQHVARHMRARNFKIVDTEQLPDWVPPALAKEYGYQLYSARYGNIYTIRQLRQLLADSLTGTVRREDVWEKDGRYYDALRPSVEPDGLDSIEEVLEHRRYHLGRVKLMLEKTDVLIITLGLTEAWRRLDTGTVYPTAPGVIAGQFDSATFGFVNFDFFEIYEDLVAIRETLLAIKPNIRFLLTVSPVPLTATASGDHILIASTRSKSILRAVCATLKDKFDNIDYFPSFEIITSPGAKSRFYESNLRSVKEEGVDAVMGIFFSSHKPSGAIDGADKRQADKPGKKRRKRRVEVTDEDVVCEDALLEAFQK